MGINPNEPNDWAKYTGLGLQIVLTVGILIALGRWADAYFGLTKPWLTLIFAILGIIGVILQMIRQIK